MRKFTYISLGVSLLLFLFAGTGARAATITYFDGSAELSYVSYDAKADGKKIYSGDSFAQKYSVGWGATNLFTYSQPQYYKLLLGYDWTSFETNSEIGNLSRKISETYGKFRYLGEVGYQPINLPISFNAFINKDGPPAFTRDIYSGGLMSDGFVREIQNRSNSVSSGVSFVFEPDRAYSMALRGLPRLYVDYREHVSKSDNGLNNVDNKTRELAVAGLNKENNWLHYRNIRYENYLNSADNYEQQQIQIGLVDYVGRRKWSALTNWITVSADGQLTVRKNENHIDDFEEYDLNFHAIATRKIWEARTFMNYNREFKNSTVTENTRVPLYIKGIWGRDTTWNVGINESRGRQQQGAGPVATSYLNGVSLGLTTFTRSSFTLSPSLSLKTEKTFGSGDAYQAIAGVTTTSTRLFSDIYSLTAGYAVTVKDDGLGTANSSTWNQKLKAKGRYNARNDLIVELQEEAESGTGATYIDAARLDSGSAVNTAAINDYMRSITALSVAWSKSAYLRNSLNVGYDLLKIKGAPLNTEYYVSHGIAYEKSTATLRLDTRYQHRDTGTKAFIESFSNYGSVEYRPDRYNDATLSYTYLYRSDEVGNSKQLDLLQRYNHYFYTKTGVLRNLATITEEYSRTYSSQTGSAITTPGRASIESQYLLLSGRYSPTSRLSLYGSVKYQQDPKATTMFYNAGAAADFKLLTTTVDYTVGTRDSDKRVEKKLAANVKRSF